jgi:hypothetical protein
LRATAADADGTVAKVDYYRDGTAIGSSTTSPYSVSWNSVAAGSYTVTAVATDDDGATTTSAPVVVVVDGANRAPAVSITSPANGSTFTTPATISITASASDPDGSVARVQFYAGSTLVGTVTSGAAAVTWSGMAAGTYSLTAVATDDAGLKTTSAPVSVTVGSNRAPAVSLTSPAAGTNYLAPATITLSANASDADGGVMSVAFYAGTTLLGTDSSSPYSFAWQNASAGTYAVTAVATDTSGVTTTSSAVSVTVSSTRTATFTASPDHNTLVASYRLDVFAAGADPSTATPVATQNLGKPAVVNGDCSADITTTLRSLPAGSYIATVSAVGTSGTTSRSAASPTFVR